MKKRKLKKAYFSSCSRVVHYYRFLFLSFYTDGLETARIVEGKLGGLILLDKEGHEYACKLKKGTSGYWSCKKKKSLKCSARAIIKGNNVLSWKGQHNHEIVTSKHNRTI